MPSLLRQMTARDQSAAPSSSERFTRALVALTRAVWHPDCTFDRALGLICETAAHALQVERANVWHYDREARLLRCLHAYCALDDSHARTETLETLSLDGDDYMAALEDVRTIDAADVEFDPSTASSHGALRSYLRKHRIQALLDAPVRIEGELLGLVCHESIARPRQWSPEEVTFAGSMGDYVAMAYEVARRHRAEKEVRHLLLHDATTNLPNRDYMVELLTRRLAAPHPADHVLAVVHVRLDASSGIALSAGAPTLDQMMAQLALRLQQFSSDEVHLARVRTDGFAFLLASNATERGVVRLAERCLAAVRAMDWQHEEIDPGIAVGIAFAGSAPVVDALAMGAPAVGAPGVAAPAVDAADVDARVLMRQAEEAADRARARGKHVYEVFDLVHHDALVERLRFERALRDAFARGHFELHYQPEYHVARRCWTAAEALLRWHDGARLVTAAEFIGVAESSGLILPLGSWVLHQACRDAAQWPATAGGAYPTVRVNVSARQFDDSGLVADVAAALSDSGLPPSRLCLELTETTLMADIDHTLGVLQQLKATGVQVAIDDFGTGYSSLVYLKRFPVDALKIDRSFVEGMPADAADTAIVAAVCGLAGSLGIEVVAEGVERIEQQRALTAIGVARMQGWLYARAMDQTHVRDLLGAAPG